MHVCVDPDPSVSSLLASAIRRGGGGGEGDDSLFSAIPESAHVQRLSFMCSFPLPVHLWPFLPSFPHILSPGSDYEARLQILTGRSD